MMIVSFPKAQIVEDTTQTETLKVEEQAGGKPKYRINPKFKLADAVFENSVSVDVSDADFAQLLNIKNN